VSYLALHRKRAPVLAQTDKTDYKIGYIQATDKVFCQPQQTEPPPTKFEGFSGLERLRRTVEIFSD
jgi:hypothetical protein